LNNKIFLNISKDFSFSFIKSCSLEYIGGKFLSLGDQNKGAMACVPSKFLVKRVKIAVFQGKSKLELDT
jgi:hypothetical protein